MSVLHQQKKNVYWSDASFADIQLDVFRTGRRSDDHSGINFFARSDKEGSTILGREQTISYGFAGLKGDQRSLLTVSNVALVWCVAFKDRIDDTISLVSVMNSPR